VDLAGRYSNLFSQAQRLLDLLSQGSEMLAVPAVWEPHKSRQTQTRLSPIQISQFELDYQAGIPIAELADRYKIHRNTVITQASRLGLPRRHPRLSPGDVARATEMYASGHSMVEIGRYFGASHDTVRRELRKAGVPKGMTQ
jgi:hypothetical protein